MLTDTAPLRDIRQLNVSYANLQVLWDVSLSIGEGEIVTLLGANGAGKTSLVQSIFGLNRPRTAVFFSGERRLPVLPLMKLSGRVLCSCRRNANSSQR